MARVVPNTYLMGTDIVHPYIKNNKVMVNVEELDGYLKRNEKR